MIKIALLKPILNITSNNSFDATKDYQVNFMSSGDQVYANEISIFRTDTNALVYNNKTIVPYFSLNHIIPAHTLTNTSSYSYKIQLRTYDSNGNTSLWSDYSLIFCYSTPNADISNVTNNGTINAQKYEFEGSYSQAQGELLQSYQYTLYDSNMMEIAQSPLLFDQLLKYSFDGFENNTTYSIKLEITTQHGMSTSVQKFFQANYIQPNFTNLITLTNNSDEASIDVQVEAIRILGHTTGNTSIENGDWINVMNGTVYFDSNNGFQIPSGDWIYQWWGKNLIDTKSLINGVLEGTLITKLYGQNNVTFKIEYYDGAFHLYKFIGDFLFSHYKSNVINANINDSVYLFVQSINNRIELQSEIIN